MNPYKLKNVFEYLTSNNQLLKKKLKLGTSEIPIPPKRDDVTIIEAINRFSKANPRVDTTNLKPLSVKQSNVKKPDEAMVQGVVSQPVRTVDPERDSFKKISNVLGAYKKYRRGEKNPKLNFNKFFELYSTENFAEGGRIGYKDGPKLTDFLDVQASGSKSGKQQIQGAPEGITSDKEIINAIITMDIPLTEKVNLIGDLQYGKFRDRIEYKDNEIYLDDPKSYRDRNIGLDFNRDGEGFSGSATVGDRGPEYKIRYKKSFADGGMLVQPSDDGSRPGYAKNKMSGSKEQQAGNLLKKQNRFSKIGELFINKDYKKLKTKTRKARMGKGSIDAGGVLNSQDKTLLNNIIFNGTVKEQNALAKELGINRRYMIEVYNEAEKLKDEGKALQQSKAKLIQVQNQKKIFDEILNNKNATIKSMAKKFKMTEKEITKESSKLLKNVYAQNVAIGKGPEFDINSRGQKTLKSWLPDNFETTDSFLDNFSNIKGLKNVQSENMSILIKNAYGDNPKKFTEAMKGLSEYNKFVNTLPEGLKLDLDHPLSKAFLKGSGVSPDKLLYVTPIDRSYNRGLKQTISMAYDKALLSGDKQKIKTIEKFAKDIKVNIGKGSGSKFDFGTSALGKKTQENLREEVLSNLREQNRTGELLSKYRKTKEGKDTIKSIFPSNRAELKIKKIDKKIIQKVMAFCPAGTVKVTKAGGGRVPYADGPVCTLEEATRGMNEEIDKIKKGNASAGESSRTLNKLKNLGSVGMRGLVKAGLVSEVLFEAALGFDKVISEGQSPMQAFRQSYLTAPLRGIGVMKSFEEGEREELLDVASDKGKVGRVLDLQETVLNRDKLINKINNLETSLQDQQDLDDGSSFVGSTEPLEKRITELKAQLQDSYRDSQVNRADELFSIKPQDLKIKDQSLINAYNDAIEKRAVKQAEKSFKPQSIAADENRLRDANKEMLNLYPQYTDEQLSNYIIDSGFDPQAFKDNIITPKNFPGDTSSKPISAFQDVEDYVLEQLKTQNIANAGGVANMASGGLANLTKTIPPESGPTPQGLPYVYNNVKKI